VTSGPSMVYLIRHGEKLGDPKTDSDGGPDLSIWGSARAAALPSLFAPANPELSCQLALATDSLIAEYATVQLEGNAPRFTAPDFVFATQASTSSNRPAETITPLLVALNLTLGASYSDDAYSELVTEIQTNSAYVGKIVLICWHHSHLADLASSLGVVNVPHWSGTVFDRLWEISFASSPPALADKPQSLLYGDSKT
jgi:hypothetical protein